MLMLLEGPSQVVQAESLRLQTAKLRRSQSLTCICIFPILSTQRITTRTDKEIELTNVKSGGAAANDL